MEPAPTPTRLIPVENCIINGYSLIENVFGTGIVVRDSLGTMYTTVRNAELLAEAQTILENFNRHDPQTFSGALNHLREAAEILEDTRITLPAVPAATRQLTKTCDDLTELAGCLA